MSTGDPDQIFKQILWRGVVSVGPAMERFTTWAVTGVAAIIALAIGNLDSVGTMVEPEGIRYAISLMVAPLLIGVFSEQLGMPQTTAMELVGNLEKALNSDQGQDLINAMKSDPEKLKREIAEPFWWPISWMMRRLFQAGFDDPLITDKRLVRRFCLQLTTNSAHVFLAAAGVITLVAYIK